MLLSGNFFDLYNQQLSAYEIEGGNTVNKGDFTFTGIFDLAEIQKLQDLFSDVNEVDAIITTPDGTPITDTSTFSHFCSHFVRNTESRSCNCPKSDSDIRQYNEDGPTLKKCLSTGLWGAGVSISVGNVHLANWVIGQVRNQSVNKKGAGLEVPVMSSEKFRKIAKMLFVFAHNISEKAHTNLQLKNEAEEKEKAILQRDEKAKELIKINQEVRLISENLPNITWKSEIGPNHEFINPYISDIADEILGLTKGTINNSFEKYFSFVVPEYLEKVHQTIAHGLANPGQIFSIAYQLCKKNGEIIWVESTGRTDHIYNKTHVFGITIDITEQKKTEDKLKESEFLLRKSQKVANLGSYILDFATGNWISSPVLDEIFGIDDTYQKNVSGWLQIVHPGDRQKMEEYFFTEILTKHKPFNKEYQITNINNGQEIWVYGMGELEFDELGNPVRMIGTIQDITAKKAKEIEIIEAKRKAEESTERYKLAMQVTLDGPYDWNLITNEIYFSHRWKAILGYKPDELPNDFSVWEKLTKPEDVKKSWSMLNKHIAGEVDKFEIEVKMQHKNGHWVDILSRAIAYFDEHGKAVRFVGTHIDITASKKAEKQLKENEERFRKLTEHLPSGIAIYRPVDNGNDFQFIDINKTAERITISKRDNLIGHRLLEKFPNMIKSPLYGALKNVNKTGKDEFIPSFYYKDAEREGWRENYVYKLNSGEIVAIFRDTTEIRNAEQRLIKQNKELLVARLNAEQNERRFKALHDATFGGIAIHDKGKILDCNKGLTKLTGFKRNELIGMDGLMLIAECSRKKVLKRILAESSKPYEAIAVRKNGEEYHVRLEGRMLPYNGKEVRVVEFRDITGIKKAEKELISAKEKAEESDRLKSAFLANMSHEIRTPMNGILGFTSLLQEQNLTGEEQSEYINIIQQSGDRMLQTVNDIIEVSKIETNQVSVTLNEVDLSEQLEYLFRFFKPEAEKKGMQLFVENEMLPEDCVVKTDEVKLSSILTNLIKNAIKYSEKGLIRVTCEKKPEHVQFSVKDEGIGIPAKRLEAVFERFVQADIEDKSVHEGSGLGLTITKSYAEMLGGAVWVESQEGEGSTFYATIEFKPVKKSEPAAKHAATIAAKENYNQTKILVAEDDDVSFMLLEGILSAENCSLIQAKNGKEAVGIFKDMPDFDLILMDLKMPIMDGIEATQIIRGFNKTIPIIAQTAYALEGDRENAIQAGCSDYISKPIKRGELLTLVRNCPNNKTKETNPER